MPSKIIVPLSKSLNRTHFSCGIEELDGYLKNRALKEAESFVTSVFALTLDNIVIGFYTLSATSIKRTDLPLGSIKKLPLYHAMPAFLLGRLAVDQRYQKKGIGEYLLMNALDKSVTYANQIGAIAVIVDAKNEKVAQFYKKYGFLNLTENPLRLFISMKKLQTAFASGSNGRFENNHFIKEANP